MLTGNKGSDLFGNLCQDMSSGVVAKTMNDDIEIGLVRVVNASRNNYSHFLSAKDFEARVRSLVHQPVA